MFLFCMNPLSIVFPIIASSSFPLEPNLTSPIQLCFHLDPSRWVNLNQTRIDQADNIIKHSHSTSKADRYFYHTAARPILFPWDLTV
ncbi:hypothetical protein BDV40DRAFT_270175 [Aspergillus tamarii]|uniref:Secreted protein n=1 Tax=Aspergillus tamarii TaxID=41984 RepID=A0A5N6UPM2_ASPTM|nr:hypothetical protein BDV40DRAFT_270175 [Aspergillus tamarii]